MVKCVANEHKSVGIHNDVRGIVELASAASWNTIPSDSDTSTRSVRPFLDAMIVCIGNVHV